MNKNVNILLHWFFLPYRLLYILIYYIFCILLHVRNEGFHIFYDKEKKIILSGWLKFYDPNKYWKQIIVVSIEIILFFAFVIIYLIAPNIFTMLLYIYSLLYLIIRYDFKSTMKYVRNWKCNQIIKKYVGEELYYYAKWNYEDLTLIFPELAQLKHHGKKCISAASNKSIPLEMCKEIWSNAEKENK
jgi:predicted membrane protein